MECVLGLDSGLVNRPDGLGATPLHYAATGASNHLTQLLITKVHALLEITVSWLKARLFNMSIQITLFFAGV